MAVGNAGVGATTCLLLNGVILVGVHGLCSCFGLGSPSMGKGLAGAAGLGDLVIVWPFFVDIGVSPPFGRILGAGDDGMWPS